MIIKSLKSKRYIFYFVLMILILIDIVSYFLFLNIFNANKNEIKQDNYEIVDNANLIIKNYIEKYGNEKNIFDNEMPSINKYMITNNVKSYMFFDSFLNVYEKSNTFVLTEKLKYFCKNSIITESSKRYYIEKEDIYIDKINDNLYCIYIFDNNYLFIDKLILYFAIYKLILFIFIILFGIDVVKSLEEPIRTISLSAKNLGIQLDEDNPDHIVRVFRDSIEEIVKINKEQKEINFSLKDKIKKMEKELLAKESLLQLSSITDGIAHQVNNNLASIKGLLQIASKENKKELIKTIENEIDKLIEFTKKFLEFSRDIPVYKQKVELKQLIENIIQRFPLESEFSIPANEIYVRTDNVLFEQVLFNIFDNIIKYSNTNKIKINISDLPDYYKLEIIDGGPGFNKEILENPYKPFSSSAKGYGLGIPTIMKISALLNHKITLENENNRAKITIYFEKYDEK